ncbi:MAG TPA: DUF1993 family protein [Polyangiaceae bacterium]|nr:DUF1993 family protein [Polyangiaceae bacterium]
MITHTEIPTDAPLIIMTRVYSAARTLVWRALTEPEHVRQWWGGPGCSNPVCEMDVRPDGRWTHVMRLPNGHELRMEFVFVEVEAPSRLVWQHADHGQRRGGPPTARMEVTLQDIGKATRWTLVTRFDSMADREAALAVGFTGPIQASSEQLAQHLEALRQAAPAPDWLHTLSVGSFVPMLDSLRGWLERGAAHAAGGHELPHARLAPDMYALTQQVQLACHHALDAIGRLSGAPPSTPPEPQPDLGHMRAQITSTLEQLRRVDPATLAGAAERDCSIPTPDGRVIGLDGLTFLRAWALPHFYFHVVTAYDILRHVGVPLGKRDYLSQLGELIRPPPA